MSVTRCSTTTSTPSPTCTWSRPGPSICRRTAGPSTRPDHARQELDLWGTILETRTTRPWPLAHYTRAVLHQCAPTAVARTVLCHGDVGPGNFLHDGGRVTALLDWEFSHLGDPMDDLGWWVFRGHDMAGGCGDLAAQLARWSARTGLPVDSGSIEYYRAFVMFRWLVSVAATLDRGGSGIDRSVHFALVPILAVRLPQALATLVGTTLPPPPATPDDSPGPGADVLGGAGRRPHRGDPAGRRVAGGPTAGEGRACCTCRT